MSEPDPDSRLARHHARVSQSARRRARLRKAGFCTGAGLLAVAGAAGGLAAAGVFSRQMLTVHGTEQVVVNSFDGMSTETAFPDITGGARVTVVGVSGAVIGTGSLSASDPSSWGPQDAVYSFTVTVPEGEPRYGIEIGRNRGTAWFTGAQMRSGPALSLTG